MSQPSDVSGAVNDDTDRPKVKEERFSFFFVLTLCKYTNIINIMITK